MAREVDRLLARLSHSGPALSAEPQSARAASTPTTGARRRPARRAHTSGSAARGESLALWARLLLGITLGGAITQWPYPRGCGLPLLGYLGAVLAVLVAGGWIAAVAWRRRNPVVHVLALVLLLWGLVLAAERVLPRIGYAAEQAGWRC